jgi:hypothetical protein
MFPAIAGMRLAMVVLPAIEALTGIVGYPE